MWVKHPPETAPRDRRILVRSNSGEFYCAHWVKNPCTDHEAWAVCDLPDDSNALLEEITCWYELPGNELNDAEVLKKATLFEKLRRMNPREFAELYRRNIEGEGAFDDLLEKWPE